MASDKIPPIRRKEPRVRPAPAPPGSNPPYVPKNLAWLRKYGPRVAGAWLRKHSSPVARAWLRNHGPAVANVVLFLFWLSTLHMPQPFWPWPMLNYLALMVFCFAVGTIVTGKWLKHSLARAVGITITIGVMTIYGALDNYTREWTTVWDEDRLEFVEREGGMPWDDESHKGPWNYYRDTYKRWSGRIVYRVVDMHEGTSLRERIYSTRVKGPISPSGRLHGHWVTTCLEPYSKTDKWYWYGEKISEGEWHLRNK